MPQDLYGFPRDLPRGVRFVVYSNEDYGWTATLAAGVNDVINFALPYPASMDFFNESFILHAIEFLQCTDQLPTGSRAILQAYLSMLKVEFAATFRGAATDTEDEALKSKFAGPILFGQLSGNVQAAAAAEGGWRRYDNTYNAVYFPPTPEGLDLVTPLYLDFVNQSGSAAVATNIWTDGDNAGFELVMLRCWFTKRRLTQSERDFRAGVLSLMVLES
jgi:hypothetical protein